MSETHQIDYELLAKQVVSNASVDNEVRRAVIREFYDRGIQIVFNALNGQHGVIRIDGRDDKFVNSASEAIRYAIELLIADEKQVSGDRDDAIIE